MSSLVGDTDGIFCRDETLLYMYDNNNKTNLNVFRTSSKPGAAKHSVSMVILKRKMENVNTT